MKKYHLLVIGFAFGCLCVQGCGHLNQEKAKADADAALAEKTRLDNETYRVFEQKNTVEGYLAFVRKYPDNVNVGKAQARIEDLEYEVCDDAVCLQDYLSRYPASRRIEEAKERLSILTVKDLDRRMQRQYGFDLLLYRLNLRNLRKELQQSDKPELASFTDSFSLIEHAGKKYFSTRLSFGYDATPDLASADIVNELFDAVLSPQLDYLQVKFKKKSEIDGFSFEVYAPPFSSEITALKFYFSTDQVHRFLKGSLSKDVLLKTSLLRIPATRLFEEDREKDLMPGTLAWTSQQDGLVKGGVFMRTNSPAFSLKVPDWWITTEAMGDRIFNARHKDMHRASDVRVIVLKTKRSLNGKEAMRATLSEGIVRRVQQTISESGKNNGEPRLDYLRPMQTQAAFPAYEFSIQWRLYLAGVSVSPGMTTCGRIVFTREHVIILSGAVMPQEYFSGRLGGGSINELRAILDSLNMAEGTRPPAEEAPAEVVATPRGPENDKIIVPDRNEEVALPLDVTPLVEDNLTIDAHSIRFKSPAFIFTMPETWRIRRDTARRYVSAESSAALPAIRIMASRIIGDEVAYLGSIAGRYVRVLEKQEGTRPDLIYNIPSDAFEKHRAFEFEIKYRPAATAGKSAPPRTVYGNVIGQDDYAIIITGETDGDIDELKALYETINLETSVSKQSTKKR